MKNMRLRTKLILSYILILIIPVTFFTTYLMRYSKQYVEDRLRDNYTDMVNKAEEFLNQEMEHIGKVVNMCAFDKTLQQAYKNDFDNEYEKHVAVTQTITPYYTNILTASSGDIDNLCFYSWTGLGSYGDSFLSRAKMESSDWVNLAMSVQGDGNIHWFIQNQDIFALQWVYMNNMPVRRSPLGVIYCSMDVNELFRRSIGLDADNWKLEILNADGSVLIERGNGEEQTSYSFVRSFRVNDTWDFVYSVSYDTQSSLVSPMVRMSMSVIIAVTIVMIGLIFLLTHNQVKNINLLTQEMNRVKTGDLEVEIAIPSHDEVGQLSECFADMLTKLKLSIAEKSDAEKLIGELENKILRSQIDPHFLDNTLSYINWRAIQSGDEEISSIACDLATFYRTCLNKGYDFISVEQEMENIRAYIDIQARLHEYSFDAYVDVDEDIRQNRMLCFLIQPLVENAIIHGVDCTESDRGSIDVHAFRQEGKLVITVVDNGPGLSPQQINDIMNRVSNGYGIYSIVKRIQLVHGDTFGLSFEKAEAGGTRAVVWLPLIVN